MKTEIFAFEPIAVVRAALACKSRRGTEVEKYGKVGFYTSPGDFVRGFTFRLVESAGITLICERGIRIAVADNEFTLFYCGDNLLFGVLSARRGVQQKFGGGRHCGVFGVENHRADTLGDFGAARFAGKNGFGAVCREIFFESANKRAFTYALAALYRYEKTSFHRSTPYLLRNHLTYRSA